MFTMLNDDVLDIGDDEDDDVDGDKSIWELVCKRVVYALSDKEEGRPRKMGCE